LIAAAAAMIDESGDAQGLTLRGVAQRVGIAAPSIYRHFDDIDHLRMAVVEQTFSGFMEERDAAARGVDDPAEALLLRCRAYCRFAVAHPGPYRFLFSRASPAKGRQSIAGAHAFNALVAGIGRCQDAGLAAARDDPRLLAAEVWATLHGLILLRLNAPQFSWPASLEEMAVHAVSRLLQLRNIL
jgi:AcrR family transcriptional regulator